MFDVYEKSILQPYFFVLTSQFNDNQVYSFLSSTQEKQPVYKLPLASESLI